VSHQAQHAAAPVVGEAGHLVDLVEPMASLDAVRPLPRVFASPHPVAAADHRTAVDAELIQRGFEQVLLETKAALQVGLFPRLLRERDVQLPENADFRIREPVQELLGSAVGPGVEQ